MSERENPEPSSHSLSDELFSRLPEPNQQVPSVDSEAPAPGSRRARREAAQSGEKAPDEAPEEPEWAEPETDTSADEAVAEEPVAAAKPAAPTLDDLFEAEQAEPAHGKTKKKRRTGCFVALIIVLAVIGGDRRRRVLGGEHLRRSDRRGDGVGRAGGLGTGSGHR